MKSITKAEKIASNALLKGIPQSLMLKKAADPRMMKLSNFIFARTTQKVLKSNDKVTVAKIVLDKDGKSYDIGWTVGYHKSHAGVGWMNRDAFKVLKRIPEIRYEVEAYKDELYDDALEMEEYYGITETTLEQGSYEIQTC